MNSIKKALYRAIYEGRWLTIDYRNLDGEMRTYWINIKKLYPQNQKLGVEGLQIGSGQLKELTIYLTSIQKATVLEGTTCSINEQLLREIEENPTRYEPFFVNPINMKILQYLSSAHRLDNYPYQANFSLISQLDKESFVFDVYHLSDVQSKQLIKTLQLQSENKRQVVDCVMNVLSIHTKKKEIYVLAYRRAKFNVSNNTLILEKEVIISYQWQISGLHQSIRQFLSNEDMVYLQDFTSNAELIKDSIMRSNRAISVDDLPYFLSLAYDISIDLEAEYEGIISMWQNNNLTVPLQAFFGQMVKKPRFKKNTSLFIANNRYNMDQLLSIYFATTQMVTYVQGPPGTGKTTMILNTLLTSFIMGQTTLLSSYNNHPIDEILKKIDDISSLSVPIIRLGNQEKMKEALEKIRVIYYQLKQSKKQLSTVKKPTHNNESIIKQIKKYQEYIELIERKEALQQLINSNTNFQFQIDLQAFQMQQLDKRIQQLHEENNQLVVQCLEKQDEMWEYLEKYSDFCLRHLLLEKNEPLIKIVFMKESDKQIKEFSSYLSSEENFNNFLQIFPMIASTSLSVNKLSRPKPLFDLCIIDEASQCNISISLLPIIRSKRLLLVGDPQQLNPVVNLNYADNEKLKEKYGISNEYCYLKNSIYQCFLANDCISQEVLLHYHYRCHPKIIDFNNRKYYNDKLKVCTSDSVIEPLVFIDIVNNESYERNTAPSEARAVVEYAKRHSDQQIGVITPFVGQKNLIKDYLSAENLHHVECGTVHAFQGDEKDVIIFSLAIHNNTPKRTYDWLKNNRELINVATSRAKKQLVLLCSSMNIDRLSNGEKDDISELVHYVKSEGVSEITPKPNNSRALGLKPYSSETEEAFLESLNHALDNVLRSNRKCRVVKEVAISTVFNKIDIPNSLFYSGRFDFVVYERVGKHEEYPILAIELDGKEHVSDELVKRRDMKKQEICTRYGFKLIRVENTYARRYQYIKDMLVNYFENN